MSSNVEDYDDKMLDRTNELNPHVNKSAVLLWFLGDKSQATGNTKDVYVAIVFPFAG